MIQKNIGKDIPSPGCPFFGFDDSKPALSWPPLPDPHCCSAIESRAWNQAPFRLPQRGTRSL